MQSTARSAWSCDKCRQRKVKCDSKDPCPHCVRREEHCTWPDHARQRPTEDAKYVQNVADLQARVERLEAILNQHGLLASQPAMLQQGPTQTAHDLVGCFQEDVASEELADASNEHIEIDDLADVADDQLQSEVHRHDEFDHQIIESPRPRTSNRFVYEPRRHRGSPSVSPVAVRQLLARSLPTKSTCDILLQSYLRNVKWIHHILHVPQFQAEYISSWQRYGLESDLPNLQWLAVLIIVLCLGSHFHSQPVLRVEEQLYAASQELLTLSNYLA